MNCQLHFREHTWTMSRIVTPVSRRPASTSPSKGGDKCPPIDGCVAFIVSASIRYTGTCRHILLMANNLSQIDVTVVGGGLAGMAAAFHLAKAGLRVLCIEAESDNKDPVGESLDWSAPELLAALGLPMAGLLDEGL